MSTSSSSSLLIGSAAVLLTAAAATYVATSTTKSSSSSETQLVEIDDELDTEMITAEDVVKVFDQLFLEMQGVVAQLSQTVQQIQMSGQVIPENQLRQLLKSEFERALVVKQKQVLDGVGIDYDCLEEATWEFLENEKEFPKVKKSFERFQKLWENISGERVVGKRPGGVGATADIEVEAFEILTADKTIEAATVYFDAITNAMGELVQKFKADGKDLRSPMIAQELQMEFSTVADDKGGEALEKINVSKEQFQKSIEANAKNPQVGRSLAMLQMKQQQAMMAMGVPAG